MAGSCEHGNEISGSIKCGEFLDRQRNYYIPKDSVPWTSILRLCLP